MDNEESKQDNERVSANQLEQIDSDFIFAIALQQQSLHWERGLLPNREREFMTLMMSESESDEDEDANGREALNFDQENAIFYVETEETDEEEDSNDDEDYDELLELEEDDGIDPDELSYEELIALGEVLGTENKGLSANELGIYLRPYPYKCQFECKFGFDKCVICQVEYEEGETVVALPCQHPYHSDCISKWLQINKVCPICNAEVSTSPSTVPTTT